MYHASEFVACESDDEDYVSMDEEEMAVGLQTVTTEELPAPPQVNFRLAANEDDSEEDEAEMMSSRLERLEDRAHNSNASPVGAGITLMGSAAPPMQANPMPQGMPPPRLRTAPNRPPPQRQQQQQQQPQQQQRQGGFFGNLFSAFGGGGRENREERESAQRSVAPEADESVHMQQASTISAKLGALNQRKRRGSQKERRRAVRRHKVNTNVVAVDMKVLGDSANTIATGDPFTCSNPNCKVILSATDELALGDGEMKLDDDQKLWVCSFCGQKNIIDIEEEEKPQGESIDYIIAPASEEKSEEENLVIFCVDVSGSMCVTQEYQGKLKLKGVHDMSSISAFNDDHSDQYLPHQKRNVTYISRLQAVQAAVDDQISDLAKAKPKNKVGLVTFSNEVTIVGDGTTNPEFIAGDKLRNMDQLKEIGSSYRLEQNIEKSNKALSEKLFKLQESGQTALGPALVTSIALASQKAGSQVILCTDGLANIGLGSLDGISEEQEEEVEKWYEDLGNWALTAGVTVNVISITDGECRLENLGKVTDISQGEVERINPLELSNNFKGILEKTVLASKVQATMYLHPVLRFRKDDEEEELAARAAEEKNLQEHQAKRKREEKSKKQIHLQPQLSVVSEKPALEEEQVESEEDKDKKDVPMEEPKSAMASVAVEKKQEEEKPSKMEVDEESSEQPGAGGNPMMDTDDGSNEPKQAAEGVEEDKPESSKVKISKTTQDIGNVFTDTKIYFEYAVQKDKIRMEYKTLENMIFQIQVEYTRPDGSKMLRVITQKKPVARSREKVLDNLNMDVISANASRKSARLCEEGDYESARAVTYSNAMWMGKNFRNAPQAAAMNNYVQQNLQFDNMMQQQQVTEASSGIQYGSKRAKKKARSKFRGDAFSKQMYGSKKM